MKILINRTILFSGRIFVYIALYTPRGWTEFQYSSRTRFQYSTGTRFKYSTGWNRFQCSSGTRQSPVFQWKQIPVFQWNCSTNPVVQYWNISRSVYIPVQWNTLNCSFLIAALLASRSIFGPVYFCHIFPVKFYYYFSFSDQLLIIFRSYI